jgi:RNA polymerase sigma factor (sigma-70 family)
MVFIRKLAVLEAGVVVALARGGDKDAYSELVRRHQSWVRSLLRRLSGNATLADDLAQQVFLAAWIGLVQLRTLEAFPGWLRSLAVNSWLKHHRQQNPLGGAEEIEELPLAAPMLAISERIDIDRALAALTPAERLCIVLCYHEGLSHADAAQLAGLPLGTVKSHVLRGRQKLQQQLAVYNASSGVNSGEVIND